MISGIDGTGLTRNSFSLFMFLEKWKNPKRSYISYLIILYEKEPQCEVSSGNLVVPLSCTMMEVFCDVNTIMQMQAEVNNVFVHEKVIDYIIALINKTRGNADLLRGASPRATLALTSMAKSHAYLNGRNYVIPQDVQKVFLPVITHRLILTPEAEVNSRKTTDIAKEILASATVPKV